MVQVVNGAIDSNSLVKANKILLGSIKQLKNARLKADIKLNEALTTIARERADIFNNPSIIEVMINKPKYYLIHRVEPPLLLYVF